jgi:hypothetical protein
MDFYEATRPRTDEMTSEDIFRNLASAYNQPFVTDMEIKNQDTVDILAQIQPMPNYRTYPLPRDALRAPARRLSPGKTPLEWISVHKEELMAMLRFLIELLDGSVEEEGQLSPQARKLEALELEIFKLVALLCHSKLCTRLPRTHLWVFQ